jgi:transcriptional regulator with XRE-family HTH domain
LVVNTVRCAGGGPRAKCVNCRAKLANLRWKIAKVRLKIAKVRSKIAKVRSKIAKVRSKIASFGSKIVRFAPKIASFDSKMTSFGSKSVSFGSKAGSFRREADRSGAQARQRQTLRDRCRLSRETVPFKLIPVPKMHLVEPGVNRKCVKKAHVYNICAILGTMQLHDAVRAARMEMKLSQKKLAEQAGIQRRQLATLEKGGNVTLNTVRKVLSQLPNLETFTIDAVNVDVRLKEPPPFDAAKFGETVEMLAQTLESLGKRLQQGQPPTPEEIETLHEVNVSLLSDMTAEERAAVFESLPEDELAVEDEDEETAAAEEGEEEEV